MMLFAVSSAVLTLWAFAEGASFTAVTVMLTVAVLELAVPSLTRKVNESLPLALRLGV